MAAQADHRGLVLLENPTPPVVPGVIPRMVPESSGRRDRATAIGGRAAIVHRQIVRLVMRPAKVESHEPKVLDPARCASTNRVDRTRGRHSSIPIVLPVVPEAIHRGMCRAGWTI